MLTLARVKGSFYYDSLSLRAARELRYARYVQAAELPAPPSGLRPGHIGLIAIGRVILGDIAATAVDLSLRGLLGIESTDAAGDWVLSPAERPGDGQDPLEYERVLLDWVARPGNATGLAALATDRPTGLAKVREGLVRDAVHRGWLHRLHQHERTRAGEELASHLRAFRRELRSARPGAPEILDGPLLPYALHFGLAGPGHPLVGFAHAWVSAFAELPDWRGQDRPRQDSEQDVGIETGARKRTLDEDIRSQDVNAMLWLTGW